MVKPTLIKPKPINARGHHFTTATGLVIDELGFSIGPCTLCGKRFVGVRAIPANCTGGKN